MGVYGSDVENFSTGKCFHFASQPALAVQETLLTSGASRLHGKKNFRELDVVLESGHCVSDL